MKTNCQKLKKGLKLVTVSQPTAQSTVLLVFAGTGSGYEDRSISGISHFLEHLMFKGTVKRPTPLSVAEAIDSVGGVMNAFTGRDSTGYYAKVSPQHFDLALDWISDIYLNAKLDEQDIKKEKKVILEELNMYLDLPMQYVDELWYKVLYDGHPLGQDIIGTPSTIKAMKRQDLIKYRREYYHAGNTVIVVAGKINQVDRLADKIDNAFDSIPTRIKKSPPVLIEKQKQPKILVHNKKTDQTHFCLGVRGYSLRQKERFPQAVLATILGGNMSSRLFSLIREQNSLAYYVKTYSESFKESGFLMTQAGVDNKRIDQAIEIILSEYGRMKKELVLEAELKKAKEYLKGVFKLSLERPENLASYYARFETLGLKSMSPEEMYRNIEKVNASEVKEIANNIFQNNRLNLALIGPSKASQFKKILKIV